MPINFLANEETLEGWRKYLGWFACSVGWHFGQIVFSRNDLSADPIKKQCANCKCVYKVRTR
jgi:hypothetical protein